MLPSSIICTRAIRMASPARVGNRDCNPDRMLDTLQRLFNAKNDCRLPLRLNISPTLLCKIRGARSAPRLGC